MNYVQIRSITRAMVSKHSVHDSDVCFVARRLTTNCGDFMLVAAPVRSVQASHKNTCIQGGGHAAQKIHTQKPTIHREATQNARVQGWLFAPPGRHDLKQHSSTYPNVLSPL